MNPVNFNFWLKFWKISSFNIVWLNHTIFTCTPSCNIYSVHFFREQWTLKGNDDVWCSMYGSNSSMSPLIGECFNLYYTIHPDNKGINCHFLIIENKLLIEKSIYCSMHSLVLRKSRHSTNDNQYKNKCFLSYLIHFLYNCILIQYQYQISISFSYG